MRRIPTLVSLDATPINYDSLGEHYGHRPAGDGFLDRQKYALNRRTFHAAAGLVTWSEWARQSLIKDYGVRADAVRVVAPGAAPGYFDIGFARAMLNTPRRPGIVRALFVGGDFARKGGHDLLAAMRGPLADTCEVHLVTQADIAPQKNVYVHRGLTPNSPELLRLFAEADFFVFPTHADCLAMVLMEAAAAGLPVITTDVGALAENVEPGRSGFVIRHGDVGALTLSMRALIADAELRQRMSRATFAVARERFDAQRNNRVVLDLLGALAEARPTVRRAA
jgi:glycosyltransferase involved in cell wall biosynthesis